MGDIEIKPYTELPEVENDNTWSIESITHNAGDLSYEDFFNNYMRKNIPCIIKNISNNWECSKKWIRNDKIDYDYMINEYGNLYAPVADCNNIKYNTHSKREMKISEYMNYLRSDRKNELLYLKDWHLRRARPHQRFYTIPNLFASDWLNEYAMDKRDDDFMFVYIGPQDSWTALHADVYNSFSWSVNIVGRKKWILFPPGEEEKLKDKFNNPPMMFDPKMYKDVTYYEIVQEKGDALFVPSHWYHQVVNVTDTVSVNHNWVNGCNIAAVWQVLTNVLVTIEKEIDELNDIPEFPSMCQTMLKALHGIDFELFVKWITHIGEKRLFQLQGSSRNVSNNFRLGVNHIKYDLKCILNLINMITAHPAYVNHEFRVNDNFLTLQDFLTDYF